jgi:uncharacterized membrane protein YkvA (DUF1232 family)
LAFSAGRRRLDGGRHEHLTPAFGRPSPQRGEGLARLVALFVEAAGGGRGAYNAGVKNDLRRRIMALSVRSKLRFAWRLFRDPETPGLVKGIMPAVLLYLASPIDIIPDFIPVLGQLDDLLVLFAGLGIVLWLTPSHVIEDHLGEFE